MSLPLPPIITPGQGVSLAFATVAEARSGDMGASNGSASYGLDPTTGEIDGSGLVTMTGSCGLCNWQWGIKWTSFVAPTLPANATVSGIYALLYGTLSADCSGRSEASAGSTASVTPWNVSMGEAISCSTLDRLLLRRCTSQSLSVQAWPTFLIYRLAQDCLQPPMQHSMRYLRFSDPHSLSTTRPRFSPSVTARTVTITTRLRSPTDR
jgi:hypothetical protein